MERSESWQSQMKSPMVRPKNSLRAIGLLIQSGLVSVFSKMLSGIYQCPIKIVIAMVSLSTFVVVFKLNQLSDLLGRLYDGIRLPLIEKTASKTTGTGLNRSFHGLGDAWQTVLAILTRIERTNAVRVARRPLSLHLHDSSYYLPQVQARVRLFGLVDIIARELMAIYAAPISNIIAIGNP